MGILQSMCMYSFGRPERFQVIPFTFALGCGFGVVILNASGIRKSYPCQQWRVESSDEGWIFHQLKLNFRQGFRSNTGIVSNHLCKHIRRSQNNLLVDWKLQKKVLILNRNPYPALEMCKLCKIKIFIKAFVPQV